MYRTASHLLAPRRVAAVLCALGLLGADSAWARSGKRADPAPAAAPDPSAAARPASRAALIRTALERSPALRAATHREKASKHRAAATNRLPDPELMLEVWQVPVTRPYAIQDAGMIMLGVKQAFPPAGSLSAREAAISETARVARAERSEAARVLARDVGHAFADYLETTARHRIHAAHIALAERVVRVAQARYAAGGAIGDVTQAEVEASRARADAAGESARLRSIRARLNALLSRPAQTPLGPPEDRGPQTVATSTESIVARALERRPDLESARAKRAVEVAEQRAVEKEATAPAFTVGGLYFPPTNGMTEHGYGASLSVSLPWLWGGARQRRAGQRETLAAASADVEQARLTIGAEVAAAISTVDGAVERLRVLTRETLPAARRNLDLSLAGYESGGGAGLLGLLTADRDVVDLELEIVMARATLDHALTDLDFAAGGELPRRPLALEGH